jgi:CcmD family protein
MISILQAMTANNTDNLMIRDGKIYLVMTIVSIILVGLFIYVASIDKKISQLERGTKD